MQLFEFLIVLVWVFLFILNAPETLRYVSCRKPSGVLFVSHSVGCWVLIAMFKPCTFKVLIVIFSSVPAICITASYSWHLFFLTPSSLCLSFVWGNLKTLVTILHQERGTLSGARLPGWAWGWWGGGRAGGCPETSLRCGLSTEGCV